MPKFTVTFAAGEPEIVEAKSLIGVAVKMQNRSVVSIERYVPKMVTRVNLMTGKEYQEAEDTPLSCSPASETYWSM